MAVEAGGDTRCGIGTRLRAGREKRGLTVLQAAEKLHVDAKILESLESEDFAALGAPVYVRGHLRHYAELIGESAPQLQELYSNGVKTAQPDLTRIPKAERSSDPGRLVAPALVVLIGFAAAGIIWWVLSLSGEHTRAARMSGETQSQPTATSAGSTQTALVREAPPVVNDGARAASAASSAVTHPSAARQAPAPLAGATTTVAAGSSAIPGQAQATPRAAPEAATRAPRQAELTLKFSADSWAEVYDASGERLFYDVGSADSVHTVKGTPPLRVVLANAPGVAVEINGRPAAITNMVRADGSAQFAINRSGRAVRAKPAADGG